MVSLFLTCMPPFIIELPRAITRNGLMGHSRAGFVDGLSRLIEDEGLRSHLSQQSLKLADEKYNTANYLAKLEKIYEAVQPATPSSNQPVQHIQIKD